MSRRDSPNAGSWNDWLSTFEVGERRYVETTAEDYASTMRIANTPLSRRPEILKGKKFSGATFTAVANSKVGEVRVLVCIERVV